jgi:hypothetical protein
MRYDYSGSQSRIRRLVLKYARGTSPRAALRLRSRRQRSFTRTNAAALVLLVVSAGLLSVRALVGGPATSAPAPFSLDVEAIERTTPAGLPLFEDQHQRHYGVLESLDK